MVQKINTIKYKKQYIIVQIWNETYNFCYETNLKNKLFQYEVRIKINKKSSINWLINEKINHKKIKI